MWRCQPPVYTPVPYRALWQATVGSAGGPPHRGRLAALLRTVYQADRVMLVGSGTDALTLALQAVRLSGGGRRLRVALPAFSCFDVATAAVGAEAEIVLYDLDPRTLGPDLASLSAACAAGAAACIVAPLFGVPVDWPAVEAVAAMHGTVVIEDAAQGHGALLAGRPLGSWGAMSVLSFGRGKGWTGGGGGALLLRRRFALTEPALAGDPSGGARALGKALAQRALGGPGAYRLPSGMPWLGLGATRYHDPQPPTRMPAAVAALLMASRQAAEAEADRRRATGARLMVALRGMTGVTVPPVVATGRAGFLRLPVCAPHARARVRERGGAHTLGIAPSYPWPLSDVPAVRRRLVSHGGQTFPGARMLARDLVTLPTHSFIRRADRAALLSYVQGVFGRAAGAGAALRPVLA